MQLTPRPVAYVAMEEGIVREAYYDNDNPPTLTWAMGLTAAAGVNVKAYVNRPAPLVDCIKASIAHLSAGYLPAVEHAFAGHTLTEAQLAAALGFEWNTGAVGHAAWVAAWKAGQIAEARHDLVNNYLNDGTLAARRNREAALFFDNTWPTDMRCAISQVSHPSHRPYKPVATDIMPILQQILGGA